MRKKLTVKRRPYTRSDGTSVQGVLFKTPDKGAPGRTPKHRRWYNPDTKTGWQKQLPATERRRLVLKAFHGNLLSAGRSLQALSNVTADNRTRNLAGVDARYFFREHKKRLGR